MSDSFTEEDINWMRNHMEKIADSWCEAKNGCCDMKVPSCENCGYGDRVQKEARKPRKKAPLRVIQGGKS